MKILIVFFSGFAVFFPGNFTAAGFLTYYINIAIFAVLYIFFKFFLESKVVPLGEIEFEDELKSVREWRVSEETGKRAWWHKVF